MQINLINLDRSTDRLVEFKRRNIHLRNVARITAVDSRLLDRSKLIDDGVLTDDCEYSDGHLGNAMSHITVWHTAVAEQRVITVAEDDAIFGHGFEISADRVLSLLPPDWDMIFWGWNFDAPIKIDMLPGVSGAVLQCDQDQMRQNIDRFQGLETTPMPARLLHIWGLMSYTVSPKGAKALLNTCLPLRPVLIDVIQVNQRYVAKSLDATLNSVHDSLKSFVCIPPLVICENRHDTSLTRGRR